MKNLVVHMGLQPGELLLQSTTAHDKGVVVVPPSTKSTRFSVEQLAGPTFALMRVSAAAWPEPAQREALFSFPTHEAAQQALEELEASLMHAEDSAAEPPAATQTPVGVPFKNVAILVAIVGAISALGGSLSAFGLLKILG